MDRSILSSIKKLLGIDESYTAFDTDIIIYINSIFPILHQLGIGPATGFMIEDDSSTWDEFLRDPNLLNMVQTYMGLRVRLLFDPPASPQAISAAEKQIEEFGWRINMQREMNVAPVPVLVVVKED